MNDSSNQLDKALTECCARLNECAEIIDALNSESRDSEIQNIGRAMAEIFELRTNLYKLNPDLKPKGWDDPLSETDLKIMYKRALRKVDQYLEAGKPEKAIETLESFIFIGPSAKYLRKASSKINQIQNEHAL